MKSIEKWKYSFFVLGGLVVLISILLTSELQIKYSLLVVGMSLVTLAIGVSITQNWYRQGGEL